MKNTEFEKLRALRAVFLDTHQGIVKPYWDSAHTLELYDTTFARRIGWKWDTVCEELVALGWEPSAQVQRVIDWGCGSGVASETFLRHFPATKHLEFCLHDHGGEALTYTANKLRADCGVQRVEKSIPLERLGTSLLLVSHVLTELSEANFRGLIELAQKCAAVIWIEPGSFACSQKLVQVRERLRACKSIVAPCLHQGECGLQRAGNGSDWCHFFAKPPPHVFQDSFWARFSREFGIDLRSLPVSYLALDENFMGRNEQPKTARVLGRSRVHKGCAHVCACNPDGVETVLLQKKQNSQIWPAIEAAQFRALCEIS